jgi:phage gp29-like protein
MVETRRSSILGPDGQPIQVPLLKGETAAPQRYGARALVYYSEASGLTPGKLGEIIKGANMGLAKPYLTLAIDMEERYTHYASQLQTRRLALDGVTTSVSAPKGVDAKAVDFVESLINDPEFTDVVASLQDGVGKGYSVIEPVWEYQEGALRPIAYQHRDPRYFRYDEIGLRDLCLLEDSGLPGPRIEAPYFIKHEPWLRAGPPIRRGVARPAAWAYIMQTFALQDWAAFCEIYGIPFRIGKYHSSASNEDKATLLRAVRAIANDAAAIIPEGMTIDFQETNGNRGEAVFGNFITYLDNKVSLIILGQTMTAEVSKSGGSLAQAKVQENVRMDIVRFDARQHAKTINRDLIRHAVAMNFGPQEIYPAVEMELAENEDLIALGTFIEKASAAGLKIGQKYVRKKASIPEPEEDDELLTPPGGAKENGGPEEQLPAQKRPSKQVAKPVDNKKGAAEQLAAFGCTCPNCGGATTLAADDPTNPSAITALDDTEALVDEALSDWREIRDPLLAGLLAAVREATTFEEALANIEMANIDSTPLQEALARATAKSRGLGDVRD